MEPDLGKRRLSFREDRSRDLGGGTQQGGDPQLSWPGGKGSGGDSIGPRNVVGFAHDSHDAPQTPPFEAPPDAAAGAATVAALSHFSEGAFGAGGLIRYSCPACN